jgi:hypothetical protein
VKYGKENSKDLRFIWADALGDFLCMLEKWIRHMFNDNPWLPVNCVSRVNKEMLPFTELLVGV